MSRWIPRQAIIMDDIQSRRERERVDKGPMTRPPTSRRKPGETRVEKRACAAVARGVKWNSQISGAP